MRRVIFIVLSIIPLYIISKTAYTITHFSPYLRFLPLYLPLHNAQYQHKNSQQIQNTTKPNFNMKWLLPLFVILCQGSIFLSKHYYLSCVNMLGLFLTTTVGFIFSYKIIVSVIYSGVFKGRQASQLTVNLFGVFQLFLVPRFNSGCTVLLCESKLLANH